MTGNPEVADFLAHCRHSPKWIGPAEGWTISSFEVHKDRQDKNLQVTALLCNPAWKIPTIKALNGDELFVKIKEFPPTVLEEGETAINIGWSRGLYGRITSWEVCRFLGHQHSKKSWNILIFGRNTLLGQPSVVKNILEDIGHAPGPKSLWDFSPEPNEESQRALAQLPIAIQLDEADGYAYPLVGVHYKDGKITLITEQDETILL